MKHKIYHEREWLNPLGTFADSSISSFHGKRIYKNEQKESIEYIDTFLSIKDCYHTVKFHVVDDDLEGFIKKLETMKQVIDNFINHLKD